VIGGAAAGGQLAAALGGEGTAIAAGLSWADYSVGRLAIAWTLRIGREPAQRRRRRWNPSPQGRALPGVTQTAVTRAPSHPYEPIRPQAGSIAANIRRPSLSGAKGISPMVPPAASPMGPGELSAKRRIWSHPKTTSSQGRNHHAQARVAAPDGDAAHR
jgi:hypothetical protein